MTTFELQIIICSTRPGRVGPAVERRARLAACRQPWLLIYKPQTSN